MNRWIKFILALLLLGVGALIYRQIPPSQPTSGSANLFPTFILDAGHGGEDGGAISVTGTSESNINLAITLKLEQILALYGAPPTLLRETDISLHNESCTTLREKKVSDLHNRVDTVENTQNGILVSIHQNSYPDSQYHGFQTFYAPTDGSQPLAETVQLGLKTAIDPKNTREVKKIYDSVYLLNHITRPAILVECGFLTNTAEAERLETEIYQQQLAMTIGTSLLNYTKEELSP